MPKTATPLVEWVQYRTAGGFSAYHARLSTAGGLLCGRRIPPGSAPAADSFPPVDQCCRVCRFKLGLEPFPYNGRRAPLDSDPRYRERS